MAHLLSIGHRQIGFVYGVQGPFLGEDRLVPYQESLLAAGLPVKDELIIRCGATIQDGYQAAEKLLQHSIRPTALIAINDLLAIGVMRAAVDVGLKIPQDLSVVGYDDIPFARYMVPRLTTVSKMQSASEGRRLSCYSRVFKNLIGHNRRSISRLR